jgi:hypothetical protein
MPTDGRLRGSGLLLPFALHGVRAQRGQGPLVGAAGAHPKAGWATHFGNVQVADGSLTVTGNARTYLVQDHDHLRWEDHKYVRLNPQVEPVRFTLDLSGVPCGCLACVYMVKMKDPSDEGPNYVSATQHVEAHMPFATAPLMGMRTHPWQHASSLFAV